MAQLPSRTRFRRKATDHRSCGVHPPKHADVTEKTLEKKRKKSSCHNQLNLCSEESASTMTPIASPFAMKEKSCTTYTATGNNWGMNNCFCLNLHCCLVVDLQASFQSLSTRIHPARVVALRFETQPKISHHQSISEYYQHFLSIFPIK